MCDKRVLILAVVTDLHDTTVTYPCCLGCQCKLLVDPTTRRLHCIRCVTSCDRRQVQWRYRLVVSVSDSVTIGRVVVFGRTLDSCFGKSATDFTRSVEDLERSGYPASSMLSEALLKTFLGKYFYFGFKLTGSTNVEESPSLRHVLKSDNSLCGSQLDCTSDFENSHTLAYQMLACSDVLYATVTDHMRLSVKLLRNYDQSEHIKTPHLKKESKNQSADVIAENQFTSNLSRVTPGSSGCCRTVSGDVDQESVIFSFETCSDHTYSPQEIEKQTGSLIKGRSINLGVKGLQGISFVKPEVDIDREHFLATNLTNDAHSNDWPSCVTLDSFNEDAADSSIPLKDTHNKLPSLLTQTDMRNQSSNNDYLFYQDYASMFGNTFSQIPVTMQLEFGNHNETVTGVSDTSKRIDKELKRREMVLSRRNVRSRRIHVDGSGMNQHCVENETEATVVGTSTTVAILEDISVMNGNGETSFMNTITSNEMTKTCDKVLDIAVERRPDGNIISELNMPESEDLNAFFDSQFDGIIFTQEAASAKSNSVNDSLRKDSEFRILNKREYEKKAAGLSKRDVIEINENRIIESENTTTMENLVYNLPESEGIEHYVVDSFEHCSLLNGTATQQLEIGCVVQGHTCTVSKSPEIGHVMQAHAVSPSSFVCKDSTNGNCLSLDRGSIDLSYTEEYGSAVIDVPDQQAVADFESSLCNISTRDNMNTTDDVNEQNELQTVNKTENTRFVKVQVDDVIMEECLITDVLKLVNCVDGKLVDTSEDNASYLEDFFHELSMLSIDIDTGNADGIESFIGTDVTKCVPSHRNTKYTDPHFRLASTRESEEVIGEQKIQSVSLVEDNSLANESIEECNIIDKTSDFEETNHIVQKIKSVFRLVPFCKSRTGHKFKSANTLPSVICENNKSITKCDNTSTNNRGTCDNAKRVSNSTATTEKMKNIVGKKESKCVYNETSFVNLSADLFEISWEHEHNAALILTVKTPSFNSSPVHENVCLNEFLVCDTPQGTSTPVLNKCIILESRDSSEINDSDVSNNLADVDKGERKVRFNARLRRVSSCHVMDLRMKLNESPLSRFQILPKSCLKSFKSMDQKQTSTGRNNSSTDEDILSIVMENITAETLPGITCRKDDNHVDNNDDQYNSACLDASFDLFAESFVTPEKQTNIPKEHLIIPVKQTDAQPKHLEILLKKTNTLSEQECKDIEKTEASIRIGGIKDTGTADIVKMKVIQDVSSSSYLWSDDSSDLWVCDAVQHHVIENENLETFGGKTANNRQSLKNDKNENQKIFFHESLGITDVVTPDLFSSQEDAWNKKSIDANRSDQEKCSANCFSNRIPMENNKHTSECGRRHVLKCFMINTPTCDTSILPKKRSVTFKSHNQSLHSAKNVENLENSNKMKESIYAEYSPDLFSDSPNDADRQPACDSKTVPIVNNVLCKKLFF